MMTVADSSENETKAEHDMEQEEGMDVVSVKEESVAAEEDEEELAEKPAPIKIPEHDVEVAVSALPSMIGDYQEENGVVQFSGLWAMNDYSHGLDGQTSEFQYRLVEKSADSLQFPPSGKYHGWFYLKHPAPKPGHIKIDDKDITMTFTPSDSDDSFKVIGEGQNKFGRFSIHGTVSSSGKFHVYKIFKKKPASTPKVSKSLGGIKPLPSGEGLTPREGRVRRPSAVLSGALDVDLPPAPPRNVKQASAPTPVGGKEGGRAQRLSIPMQKCTDLLKELNKHVQSVYFREPVDYVKLCIPDYITIVKEPMDFQTIQTNLEKSLYQSHEAFAEHVRLVFKNAITYNQRRDHPVHVAAREMSNKFEEKYRLLVSQLNNNSDFETNFRPGSLGASVTGERTGGGGRGRGGGQIRRQSSSGGMGGRSGVGPREVVVIPPALDVNMQTLVEMQRAMKEMQEELAQIKNQLRQYDIRNSIEIQRQASHDPMSLEEKQTLVERINRLDEDRMKEVIDIIREMFPAAANGDGEDVDIPIDDLDTLTLRRLQSIVMKSEKETNKRRRSSAGTPKQPGAKRSKSSNGMANTPKGGRPPLQSAPSAPMVAVQPLHHDTVYNNNPFFGANDDDLDLLGGNEDSNDEPVSMDTGMPEQPNRPTSGWQSVSEPGSEAADYTELMMEVASSQQEEEASRHGGKALEPAVVLKNEAAWASSESADAVTDVTVPNGGKRWGDDAIQEKINSERLEEMRRMESERARDLKPLVGSGGVLADVLAANNAVAVAETELAMNQRREEERRKREEMSRTINLDQHREALYQTDDA